jgi:hypothetical protein
MARLSDYNWSAQHNTDSKCLDCKDPCKTDEEMQRNVLSYSEDTSGSDYVSGCIKE